MQLNGNGYGDGKGCANTGWSYGDDACDKRSSDERKKASEPRSASEAGRRSEMGAIAALGSLPAHPTVLDAPRCRRCCALFNHLNLRFYFFKFSEGTGDDSSPFPSVRELYYG